MKFLNIITRAGAVGMGLALLWHFSNIWQYGSHYIQEPQFLVLVFETALIAVLIILSAIKLVSEIKPQ